MADFENFVAIVTGASAGIGRSCARMLADAWETDEAQAGIGGFFKKQPPPWVN